MTNRVVLSAAFAAALVCLPAAAKMKVKTEHQAGNSCTQYKTYEWLPTRTSTKAGIVEDDPKNTPAIKAAINAQLQAKGLKEVASGGELQVATFAVRQTTPHTDALVYAWFPDYYAGSYWSSGSPSMALTSFSKQGAFAVNLIDTKTKKSAWVALAKDTVDSDKAAQQKLDKAVQKMFEDFPPKKP